MRLHILFFVFSSAVASEFEAVLSTIRSNLDAVDTSGKSRAQGEATVKVSELQKLMEKVSSDDPPPASHEFIREIMQVLESLRQEFQDTTSESNDLQQHKDTYDACAQAHQPHVNASDALSTFQTATSNLVTSVSDYDIVHDDFISSCDTAQQHTSTVTTEFGQLSINCDLVESTYCSSASPPCKSQDRLDEWVALVQGIESIVDQAVTQTLHGTSGPACRDEHVTAQTAATDVSNKIDSARNAYCSYVTVYFASCTDRATCQSNARTAFDTAAGVAGDDNAQRRRNLAMVDTIECMLGYWNDTTGKDANEIHGLCYFDPNGAAYDSYDVVGIDIPSTDDSCTSADTNQDAASLDWFTLDSAQTVDHTNQGSGTYAKYLAGQGDSSDLTVTAANCMAR